MQRPVNPPEKNRTPLPIDAHLPTIEAELARARAVVLVAEPGAGKTTRVPAHLLEHRKRNILVLEPRRVAARLTAQRVADELGVELGTRVGYAVRGENVAGKNTQLLFLTEGLLIRRFLRDPGLLDVGTVILDEFHERSIHTDLAIALVRQLQRTTRPDLELVVMSATLDAKKIADYLAAPIVSASGRTFPIDVEYVEPALLPSRTLSPEQAVAKAIRRAAQHPLGHSGHVLAFLPGAREIRRVEEALRGLARPVHMLHGDMNAAEQARVLAPSAPKVILTTNVAETSLTIDGVTAVVDSGLARVSRFSPWSGLPELAVEKVSRASATQRAGRAGRLQPGYALRVYSKQDFDARSEFLMPELLRSDLTETFLLLSAMAIHWRSFAFFESPRAEQMDYAEKLAERLHLARDQKITALGRAALSMPMHPRLARAHLAAATVAQGDDALLERSAAMVALLEERERLPRGSDSVHDSDSDTLDQVDAYARGDLPPVAARRIAQSVRTLARFRAEAADEPHREVLFAQRDAEEVLRQSILLAFPDRVAKRLKDRGDDKLHFALEGGGSFVLSQQSAVRNAEWIVAAAILSRDGVPTCDAATAIDSDWLYEFFLDRLSERDGVEVDKNTGVARAWRGTYYGALALEEKPIDAKDSPAASRALAEHVRKMGLQLVVDMNELVQWQRRFALLQRTDPGMPLLDDARIDTILLLMCQGKRSIAEVQSARFLDVMSENVGYDVVQKVEAAAPRFLNLPGRKNVVVHYEADRPPWIESRMQDFFGLKSVPKIGAQNLVVHLLAPNQRAEQVTQDLPNFWQVHYPTLRSSLMRRYPRHAWPEDPTQPLPPKPPAAPRKA